MLIIFLTIFFTLLYALMGYGVSKYEKHYYERKGLFIIMMLFWPFFLVNYATTPEDYNAE